MRIVRCILICVSTFLTQLIFAQANRDPFNPSNWHITSVTTGYGQQNGIEKDYLGHEQSFDNPRSTASFECTIWNISHAATLSATCGGSTVYTIQWVGDPNYTPATVVVYLTSTSIYSYTYNDTITGAGDPGLPVIDTYQDDRDTYVSGEAYRRLPVNGSTATTSVTGSASCTLHYTSNMYALGGHGEWGAGCEIAQKALTINSEYDPSYVLGPNDAPLLHTDADLANRHVYTALTNVDNNGGHWSGAFYAELIGIWHTPYSTYLYPSWFYTMNPLVHTEDLNVSLSQLSQMIQGSPADVYVPLTMTDSYDGQSRSAKIDAHVYPQRYMPSNILNFVQKSSWFDVTPRIYLTSTSHPNPVTIVDSAGTSITTSCTVGISSDLSAKFLDIYSAVLKGSVSWTWGQQVTYTNSVSTGYTPMVPPTTGVTWEYCIQRRRKWKHVEGISFRYGANGYQGLDTFVWDGFLSSTPQLASVADFDEQEHYEGPGAPSV